MKLRLEPDETVDAATSAALGASPQVLPFSTDPRARTKLIQWLREHGVGGDLARLSNARLCQSALMQWLRRCGDVQVYQAGERFVAALADCVTATGDEPMVALARLVLLVANVGFADAVREHEADETEERSQPDRGEYDPFDL